jgi:hypothetical protein
VSKLVVLVEGVDEEVGEESVSLIVIAVAPVKKCVVNISSGKTSSFVRVYEVLQGFQKLEDLLPPNF